MQNTTRLCWLSSWGCSHVAQANRMCRCCSIDMLVNSLTTIVVVIMAAGRFTPAPRLPAEHVSRYQWLAVHQKVFTFEMLIEKTFIRCCRVQHSDASTHYISADGTDVQVDHVCEPASNCHSTQSEHCLQQLTSTQRQHDTMHLQVSVATLQTGV